MAHKKIPILCLILFVGAFWANAEDFHAFDKDRRLDDLSPPIRCFFDAAAQNDSKALTGCFSTEVSVNIAGMRFNGSKEVIAFAERDIWGGKYKVERTFKSGKKEIVHCLFWPPGWPSRQPSMEYQFQTTNGKIISWYGRYRYM